MDLRKPVLAVRVLNLEVQLWLLSWPEYSASRRPGLLSILCVWPLTFIWWENMFGDD